MNDPIISYRGASARLSDFQTTRVDQLEQQQATQLVQYRGANKALVANAKPAKRQVSVSYRGATVAMDI